MQIRKFAHFNFISVRVENRFSLRCESYASLFPVCSQRRKIFLGTSCYVVVIGDKWYLALSAIGSWKNGIETSCSFVCSKNATNGNAVPWKCRQITLQAFITFPAASSRCKSKINLRVDVLCIAECVFSFFFFYQLHDSIKKYVVVGGEKTPVTLKIRKKNNGKKYSVFILSYIAMFIKL